MKKFESFLKEKDEGSLSLLSTSNIKDEKVRSLMRMLQDEAKEEEKADGGSKEGGTSSKKDEGICPRF